MPDWPYARSVAAALSSRYRRRAIVAVLAVVVDNYRRLDVYEEAKKTSNRSGDKLTPRSG
jgi:hypothetical protein